MTDAHASSHTPALFRRWPALRRRIAWLPLADVPTPVEPLALDGAADGLWIKRDDLSGSVYGGNKVRKLEFLLADARRDGVERLITAGAIGSHHVLATVVYGRRLGLRTSAVLFPQPVTDHVQAVLRLHHAFGAELRYTRRMELVPLAVWRARLAHRGERVRVIPPGGSDALGALGYASAALELAEQIERGEAPAPAAAHVAAGTLGTAAGLALGFTLAELDTRVVATRIASRLVTNRWTLRRLVRGAARLLADAGGPRVDADAALGRIELSHRRIGDGYGHPVPAARRAADRLDAAAIRVDPTYTAKAAADALAALESDGGPRLFWHTLSARSPEPPSDAEPGAPPPRFAGFLDG